MNRQRPVPLQIFVVVMGSINSFFGRIQKLFRQNRNRHVVDITGASGLRGRYMNRHNAPPVTLTTSSIPSSIGDRRFLLKVCKTMDEVVKLCQSQKLNLKSSPPFILDILPDTYAHLMLIFTNHNNMLRDNELLRIFMNNLVSKCKEVSKLFRNTSIYDEKSEYRRALTKYSLILSHMLFELRAEFPNGVFVGDKFRITKKAAEDFWNSKFGKSKHIVPWPTFLKALEQHHGGPISKVQAIELKKTLDLSDDGFISTFEFDVFTRLFYPFKTVINNWQTLTTGHPAYCAFMTYDEVRTRLESLVSKPGSYIFRLSCTRPGQWAIGYVAPDGRIYQTIPQNKSLIQALFEGSNEGFYKYPNGRDHDISLDKLMEAAQAERVIVHDDQNDLYTEMGTTFEMCKICDDQHKNTRIEPCGHLLCHQCLDTEGGGATCPFCRYEIKGTNAIVIDRVPAHRRRNVRDNNDEEEFVEMDFGYDAETNEVKVTIVPQTPAVPSVSDLPIAPPPLPPRPQNRGGRSNSTRRHVRSYVNVEESLPSTSTAPTITAPPLPPRPANSSRANYVNAPVIGQRHLLD
ncbi:unnamed protein product [Caenorhabditis bovis]|uniref:E3 ubiquitin-protein ligase CBL n=1 Tax=Caenorhabditis bovis TaxID=2654633 RepID=A0A8S1EEQ8_9PELO|nr:unnamed protein product [Caenorhabditis bovis]